MTIEERKALCDQACVEVAQITDAILLSFSAGKDSVCTWLQCKPYFKRVIPFYLYTVPHLGFVDRALAYYEEYFGERIYRLPHPNGLKMLNNAMYGVPFEAEYWLNQSGIGNTAYTYRQLEDVMRACEDVPESCYTAIGVRAGDSLQRRLNVRQNGAVRHGLKTFYPIAYYEPDDLCTMMEDANIALPPDYHMFHRSFDGFSEMYVGPIKAYYPEDYAKILRYFPLAGADIFRKQVRLQRNGVLE